MRNLSGKGYELLRSGPSPYEIPFDVFEENHDVRIDSSFRRFARNVMLGADEYHTANFDLVRIFDHKTNFISSCGQVKAKTISTSISEVVIDRFLPNAELIRQWDLAIESDSLFSDYGLLPIGYLYEPVHTRLFLATRMEDSGNIFCDLNEKQKQTTTERVELLSPDIWSLIEQLEEVLNEELIALYEDQGLVKHWGEDFWRVLERQQKENTI